MSDDWKLVPPKPTAAMCIAYKLALKEYIGNLPPEIRQKRKQFPHGYLVPEEDKITIRWRAMLAAAPIQSRN